MIKTFEQFISTPDKITYTPEEYKIAFDVVSQYYDGDVDEFLYSTDIAEKVDFILDNGIEDLRTCEVRCVDVIEDWVEENWEEYLDEDTVDALHDLFDMGGILGKRQLNGGRFEAFRDFQILVEDNVITKIKDALKPAVDKDDHDDDDDDDEEDDD